MTWTPDPEGFLADLEAKPAWLRSLADALPSDPWPVDPGGVQRVVLLGMGSSRFAALPAAGRLRARGIDAVAEHASAEARHPGGPGTLAIGISSSGSTAETVEAVAAHASAGSSTIALTNAGAGSALGAAAAHEVAMLAGDETGGVACRTYQHTLVRLLQLEAQLAGARSGDVAMLARHAADATDDLLARRPDWLPEVTELLTATGVSFLIAPAERLATAEQGALMLREGPRMQADACESGDWLHVDVYLTKPLDYRALLFAGSRFDAEVMSWIRDRDARVVCVGGAHEGSASSLRYAHDDDPDVALLTEIVVPELVAAARWRTG